MVRRCLLVVALLGCDGTPAPTGGACSANEACAGKLCLLDFVGGYCSSDCSTAACPGDAVCRQIGLQSACLRPCGAPEECRSSYMCFQGVCVPACEGDSGCATGFTCQEGQCVSLPGKAVGEGCAIDDDCSSRRCDPNSGTCKLACTSDLVCPGDETCWVNPIDTDRDGLTDDVLPICIPARAGASSGAACQDDSDCARGQCELGVCVTLCEAAGSCAPGMGCYDMYAQVRAGAAKMRGCVPRNGTLTVDLGPAGGGLFGFPSHVRSFNVFVEAELENTSVWTGVANLENPAGDTIVTPPRTVDEYFAQPFRYQGSEGASTLLFSNVPAIPITAGIYRIDAFALDSYRRPTAYSTRLRLKLGDAPPTAGKVALHVFITDLAGGCMSFTAANAKTVLAGFESELRAIFAQAHVTIDPIVYIDSPSTPSSITDPSSGPSLELDHVLKLATTGDTPDTLELTILRHIYGGMPGFEILGIAGGIPGSPGIPGTVHSGAVLSLTTLCADPSGQVFAATGAHELGHTLGLFHNVESSGHTDLITDNEGQGQSNLMFWQENLGRTLSPQQAQVILANPMIPER